MLMIGLAFLVYWIIIAVFNAQVTTAAAITGIAFLVAGLADGERVGTRKRP